MNTSSERGQDALEQAANAALVPEELNRVALAADRLARRRAQIDKDHEELHEAIREAHKAGSTVRLIARVAGISSTRVHQILKGRETQP